MSEHWSTGFSLLHCRPLVGRKGGKGNDTTPKKDASHAYDAHTYMDSGTHRHNHGLSPLVHINGGKGGKYLLSST